MGGISARQLITSCYILGSVGYYLEAGSAASKPLQLLRWRINPRSGTLCHWDQVGGLCLGIAGWDSPAQSPV